MPSEHVLVRDFSAAQRIFNTATIAVGGLYLTTHSVVVTVTGTIAATAACGWSMWLAHRRKQPSPTRQSDGRTAGKAGAQD